MQIIDRYFFKAYLKALFGAMILLLGVGLIAKVNDTLRYIGSYEGPASDILLMYAWSVPSFVTYIVPPAMLFAISFTMSGFINSNEVMVVLAAGRPYVRVIRPMVVFSLAFSVCFFLFNEFVAYPGAYNSYDYLNKVRGRSEGWRYGSANFRNVALIFQNRYYTLGRIVMAKNQVIGVHLLELRPDGSPERTLEAEAAIIEGNRWSFAKAVLTRFDERGQFLSRQTIPAYAEKLPESMSDLIGGIQTTHADERNIVELVRLIEHRRKTGAKTDAYETELWWHLSYPLICFFVTFIGGLLGSVGGKIGNRHSKGSVASSIGLAMVFTIAYFFIMYFGTALGDSSILPPLLAANIANLASAVLAVYVLKQSDS